MFKNFGFKKIYLALVAISTLGFAEQTFTYVNVPVLYSEPVYDNRQQVSNRTQQVKVPCQGQQNSGDGLMKLDLGTAIGAVGGVVLGNQIGSGNGKTAAKVVGGVLGGVAANGVTSSMNSNDNGDCYETRNDNYNGGYNNNYNNQRIKGYNNTFEINGQNYVKFTPNQVREIQIKITYSF